MREPNRPEKVSGTRLTWDGAASALPSNHYGGRPERSCDEVLVGMLDSIRGAWRAHERSLSSSADVVGAFTNGRTEQLLNEDR